MHLNHGVLTVSLDFELYWGMRDTLSIDQYKRNIEGVRESVPQMLQIFNDNDIHATWATVGFLFFKNTQELINNFPELLPTYNKEELSPYKYIKESSELEAVYHFAPELIELILKYQGQEFGTHTFSHYYCLEAGQSVAQFEQDLIAAIKVATSMGITLKSLVFPRNQWNTEYLTTLPNLGVQCYRGNESGWIYQASSYAEQTRFQRALRLLDTYFNLSGHNTYDLKECIQRKPFNFPSSRFLRPYTGKLASLDWLRLNRIKNAMDHAARNNRIFHLWWHPHNFGVNIKKNIAFLAKIIEHYNYLRSNYGMVSLNMGELCQLAETHYGK